MRKTTRNTPRRVIIAILAAAMTFSTVASGATPLCSPVIVYAGNDQNNVTIDSNIGFNSGNNVTVTETGSVGENQGNVSANNGTITDNQSTGDVDVNNGTINTNNGNVDNNSSTGTITTNSNNGTVGENNGTITTNEGTVTDNFGNVGTNNGTVTNNYGGTVGSGTGSVSNQFYSIGVSGENISTSYDSVFTEQNGTQYLRSTANGGYVTIAPASGYSLNGTETSGIVTNPAGYSYQIFRDSANHDNFMLMIGTPSGNQVINLSALGIISQLIGGSTTPTTPTTPTSSESTGSSSDNDSTSESVSDSSGESGLPAGWTPASDTIYRLIEAAHKRAVDQGSSVVMVDLGDNPSFDENAARSLIDKAGSNGSDCIFTVDGKAYNLIIPGGITPEQREALMRLLAQEPGGTAGPMRLVQLLNQVGVNALVKELTGGELFNRIMGVTDTTPAYSQPSSQGGYSYKVDYKLDGTDYNTTNYRVLIQRPDSQVAQKYAEILSGTEQGQESQTPASNEKATSKHVVTLKVMDSQPAINPAITGNGEPVTEPTAGVQETTVSQTAMEAQTGTSSGWTPEAEKIYSLMDAGKKQAINSGSNVVSVELGDKPNFNENAARSLIDKAASGGSDSMFTADGKAYNLVVPGGVTVEQREALMKLLAQEPGGAAGPIRLAQLLNQVGVNASVKELNGGDLFNRMMGVTDTTPASSTTAEVLDEPPVAKGNYLYKLKYKLDGPYYARANYRVIIQDPDPKASEKYKQIMNGEPVTEPTFDVVSAGPIESLQVTQPNDILDVTGVGPITSVQPIEVSQVPTLPAQVNQETLDVVSAGPIESLQVTQPNDILDVTGVGPITSVQPIEVSQVSTLPAQVNQETLDVVSAGPIELLQVTQPNDILDVTGVGPITSVQPIEVSQVSTLPTQVNQETTGTVAVAEQPSTLSGWTQEAERIYTLVDTAQKQSIQNGNSVAQVDLGDKPNFDEKATRSFIDKLNTSGADLKFTADGKAYNINVPAGTTVEQREALINLLKQEPNGEAGPARLAQLMQHVGINITFTERSGRDLVNEFTGNENFVEKSVQAVQATKSVKGNIPLKHAISAGPR